MPSFVAENLAGEPSAFDPAAQSVVILQTWASWCSPCHEALPFLRSLARTAPGLQLVLLNIDRSRSTALAALERLAPELEGATLLFDPDNRALSQIQPPGMPTTFVLVRGTVVLVEVGFQASTKEKIRAAVEAAMRSDSQ